MPNDPSTSAELEAEAERIIAEYDRREREMPSDFYALCHSRNSFAHQEHERMVLRCLRRAGLVPLQGRCVLEVGCGQRNLARAIEQLKILNTYYIGFLQRHL